MTRKVYLSNVLLPALCALVISLSASVSVAQEAESYYASNVETIVRSKCITCHRSGGQAGSTALRFTSSSSGNHAVSIQL